MSKHFCRLGLAGLAMLAGSCPQAHAQAGPYDQAKALTLAADIAGVRIEMPLSEARTRLASGGYVTPPTPTVAGGRYAGRALPPPCGPGRPPVEELRYTFPDVPRDYRELVLRYDCASQRVTTVSLRLAEGHVQSPGRPPPTVESAPKFAEARAIYEELCGDYVAARAPQTHARELEGPRELDARLRCIVTQNQAFAAMTRVDGGVHYTTSVNVGLTGPNLFVYARDLAGRAVR